MRSVVDREAGRSGGPPSTAPSIDGGWSARHVALGSALVTAPALVAAAWPRLADALTYDRAGIAQGEVWRLLTCHWTHWSLAHLSWDVLAFAILLPLCLCAGSRRAWATLALSAAAIPLLIYATLPELARYRGLSGLDSALFVLLATLLWLRQLRSGTRAGAAVFALALTGFGVKVAYELTAGAAVFVQASDLVPVPLAHLVGGVCGALVALLPAPRPVGVIRPTAPRPRAS